MLIGCISLRCYMSAPRVLQALSGCRGEITCILHIPIVCFSLHFMEPLPWVFLVWAMGWEAKRKKQNQRRRLRGPYPTFQQLIWSFTFRSWCPGRQKKWEEPIAWEFWVCTLIYHQVKFYLCNFKLRNFNCRFFCFYVWKGEKEVCC